MGTKFYLNGNKTTRKELNELLGKYVVRELVMVATERKFIKSLLINHFNMGSYGMITVWLV